MLPAERPRKDLGRLARGGAAPHNPGGSLQEDSQPSRPRRSRQGPAALGIGADWLESHSPLGRLHAHSAGVRIATQPPRLSRTAAAGL